MNDFQAILMDQLGQVFTQLGRYPTPWALGQAMELVRRQFYAEVTLDGGILLSLPGSVVRISPEGLLS